MWPHYGGTITLTLLGVAEIKVTVETADLAVRQRHEGLEYIGIIRKPLLRELGRLAYEMIMGDTPGLWQELEALLPDPTPAQIQARDEAIRKMKEGH